MPNFFYQLHFYLFGLIAIACALAFVTRKSPVAAALWLVNGLWLGRRQMLLASRDG